MTVINKSYCQFPSDLEGLSDVLSWFDQLNQPRIPHLVWLQCQLALAECFTNCVRHAHKDLPINTLVDIEVAILLDTLEIRIWDQGQPFDLVAKINQLSQSHGTNDSEEGGRGLMIISEVADKLSYERTTNGRNCFLFVKKFNP